MSTQPTTVTPADEAINQLRSPLARELMRKMWEAGKYDPSHPVVLEEPTYREIGLALEIISVGKDCPVTIEELQRACTDIRRRADEGW